jgi:ABC-type spermidine/putrescine transport system permease subunit II
VAFLQLLAGAAFMGAVVDGLLLGHWYLTDRRLTRAPINRFTVALLAAVVLEVAAVVAGGFGATRTSRELSPLLTAAGVASYVAIGMVLATALIAVMIRVTLKGQRATAVQAATGFFYLAVITAFTAELAAKVRFLP